MPIPVSDIAPIITPTPDRRDTILAIISPILTKIFNQSLSLIRLKFLNNKIIINKSDEIKGASLSNFAEIINHISEIKEII